MTAVTRTTKKRAVMRRRGLTTVEEEMDSDVTGRQNLFDLFDHDILIFVIIFVSPNTNTHRCVMSFNF